MVYQRHFTLLECFRTLPGSRDKSILYVDDLRVPRVPVAYNILCKTIISEATLSNIKSKN